MPNGDAEEHDEVEQNGNGDVHMDEAEPANGTGEKFERPAGCWGWIDNETYPAAVANGEGKAEDLKESGESFEGENKEGESKDDPEKALKDSRGGAGLNALDKVKADEGDAGKTSKVGDELPLRLFLSC